MNQPSPENPFSPSQWSNDQFREAAIAPGASRLGRGMIGHVPMVAMLLIVQGVLEILFGLMCLAFIALIVWAPDPELAQMRPLATLVGVLCVPAFGCGLLRIVAGCFNLAFRRRVLGMVALGVGLLTLMTAYCAPTAIALAIYGLIVYVNEPVIAAFEMARRGRTTSEIHAAFPPV